MRHKWTTNDGIECNFCLKCGMKKGWAYGKVCTMNQINFDKQIKHTLKAEYDNLSDEYKSYYYWKRRAVVNDNLTPEIHNCEKCKLTNNAHNYYAIDFSIKDDFGYVTYREKKNRKGEKSYSYVYLRDYEVNNKEKTSSLKYWPIYCSYTDEDVELMNIIL